MKKIHDLRTHRFTRTKRLLLTMTIMAGLFVLPSYAAGDEVITAIGNLTSLVFGLIRAVGTILLGFGMMQVGMSISSHDPSQRSQGFLLLAGGLIIFFTKEILSAITGGAV